MREKAKLITSGFLQYNSMCLGGQVRKGFYPLVFDELHLQVNSDKMLKTITEEDKEAGFMLFSAIIFCSEPVALSQFLHNLISAQSPRTIIQATVNTLKSDNINEIITRIFLNNFYLALDKKFHFQYGKILLAISSPQQFDRLITKGWSFFSHYKQDIEQCLKNNSCQGVSDLVQSLGEALL